MEIKSKLIVTRREGGGDNRGKKGKDQVKEHIKDPWTKTTGRRIGC